MPQSLTIRELAHRLRDGRTTSEALVEACLVAVASRDRELNAFITVLADDARARALETDRERASGVDLGALHGIPLSVKDLIDLEGVPTTAASRVRADHRAPSDAPALGRLRSAGAIFIGKTNLHEFAFGTTGDDSAYGPTRNPHSPDCIAGGSSSGSAVSVATGMAVASVGTDTGGSIRIPAAACGVVGLKPTFGEVSCDGVVALGPTLDHVGPLGRTVDDVAFVYQALAGLEISGAADPSEDTPVRLAVPRAYFLDVLDDEVRTQFEGLLDRLRATGCTIDDVEIPHAEDMATTYRHTVLYEAVRSHQATLSTRRDDYSPAVRERLKLGYGVSDTDYEHAQHSRDTLRKEVDAALFTRDAIVLPTLPIPAPPLGTEKVTLGERSYEIRDLTLRLTQLFDLTGHPALSVPMGTTARGLPCATQLVGGRGETMKLLEVGARYEDVFLRSSS
jgi:aspartyl-tRNA(Asn)/glutamyl-tRNA(Gln) amidotransferase subunit A